MGQSLDQYKKKRDFKKTSEPRGGSRKRGSKIFVIQEHHASHLHYDLRLEINGVLKSWAVPKGISLKTGDKRLAVPTEDHPLEYADFKGDIPEGQYGAGRVYIWDRGTYKNLRQDKEGVDMDESYETGKIEVEFQGDKLQGSYVITKMKDKDLWLVIKMKERP
jgi:DNA ligase D-like protein (predicted 3'-phosphoesterase)